MKVVMVLMMMMLKCCVVARKKVEQEWEKMLLKYPKRVTHLLDKPLVALFTISWGFKV
jgi:hypothetical protein